ncbi:MAG TPA: arylesterase [Arenimonas sp.]|uniref:arylesterase n=1 Tax=Arenimonas sp. TaxID=1872635 RepID=UPI002C03277D|nr:arylesterase [Arenimonas sp.]HMB56417.1 arylesterase [Arenimonas sp.]
MKSVHGVWSGLVQRGVMAGIVFLSMMAHVQAAPPAATAAKTVLVMGDSLSAGYGLSMAQGWVTLTAERMKTSHPGWRVVNASISGETSAGGASRVKAELARVKPAIVVIELGANDGLRGLSLVQTRGNLETMIRAAQSSKAKVLLIGMRLPPNFGPEYTHGFEENYAVLSKQYKTTLLPFLLAPVAGDRGNFQDDDLHPTAAMQPKLRDHVWVALAPLLK